MFYGSFRKFTNKSLNLVRTSKLTEICNACLEVGGGGGAAEGLGILIRDNAAISLVNMLNSSPPDCSNNI